MRSPARPAVEGRPQCGGGKWQMRIQYGVNTESFWRKKLAGAAGPRKNALMARAKLHPLLRELRGMIGGYVYRHVRGKLVVSRAPDYSRWKLTPQQKASCRNFGAAARRARSLLADPKKKAAYQAKAATRKLP